MSTNVILEFMSRECKQNLHNECSSKWEGLGFEIICTCKCSHNKKQNSGMVGRRAQSICESQKHTGDASG